MNIISSKFKPPWWCRHGHLQTLYPTFFRKKINLTLKQETFELPDGDFIDLNWTEGKKESPIIIVLHGLEGSINSPYAKGLLKIIQDVGWQGLFMHFRGCSGRHNRLNRSYHSGETLDLHTLILILKERYPKREIAVIGVSLGGNVLLKYLGEQGKNCLLTTAMAISVPFDLANSATYLDSGFSKIYQYHLISRLKKKMLEKFKNQPAPIDLNKLKKYRSFYQFDHNVTATLHGFKNADDYYTQSSSKQFLKYIKVPTLILHSKDDPFMNPMSIPGEDELSASITFELAEYGGHVGFIYGQSPFHVKYWTEKRLLEYFKPLLG